MISTRLFILAFGAILLIASRQAHAVFPTTALKPVVLKQIHSPTTITSAHDGSGRLFVCDQPGKIYIIQNGMMVPTPFLDIASTGNAAPNNGPGPVVTVNTGYSERGLLGLAFHPGFSNPASPGYRKFYVNYNKNYVAGTDPGPPQAGDPVNCVTVIAEFQVSATDPNLAVAGSERRLLVFTQPQSNHNGGQVEFGPDGFLYIGAGDGGGSNDNGGGHTGSGVSTTSNLGNGQDKTRYLGKILRIDPIDPDGAGPLTYGIPASNPFFNDPAPRPEKESYAFGLRNPWKFSFDQRPGGTNRLFCGDVGQGRIEEINLIVSGGNYGWRYKEGVEMPAFSSGASTDPMLDPGTGPYLSPIATYAHPGVVTNPVLPQLGLSVTGGFVYRGTAIPALQGKYVFGDYGSTAGASDGRMMGLEETSPGSGVFTLTQAIPFLGTSNPIVGQRILCLGEDESGELYIGLKTNAGVLALDPATTGLPAGGIYKIIPLQSFTTTLQPAKDNTIFSDNPPHVSVTGYPSDGRGHLYAGRTGSSLGPYLRRALVAFDLAAEVPAPATIQSAQLKLNLTKAGPNSGGTSFTVHRLNETWGEGTSQNPFGGYGATPTVGDATWLRRFFDTSSWTTAGGTFTATASATALQSGGPFMTWTSAALITDVQTWVTTPSSNAGWIVRGNESGTETACQFSSLQQGGVPPELALTYEATPALTRREVWLQTYFPVGQFVDGAGDLDGDAVANALEYAFNFSPLASNGPNAAAQITAVKSGNDVIFTTTFRRDPRATELTYILETTSDLTNWTPLATSVGGAVPTGSGFVSEADVAGGAPVKLVTARETVPATQNRYARIRLLP